MNFYNLFMKIFQILDMSATMLLSSLKDKAFTIVLRHHKWFWRGPFAHPFCKKRRRGGQRNPLDHCTNVSLKGVSTIDGLSLARKPNVSRIILGHIRKTLDFGISICCNVVNILKPLCYNTEQITFLVV